MFSPRGFVRLSFCVFLVLAVLLTPASAPAQSPDKDFFKGLEWRLVGPFRGGRVLAVTGVPGDASTFYFGAVAGGVWKTTDGGLTWVPLTDKTPIMSVGAIAVAPSDPNVIYVGTGESCLRGNISFGDGMYKSVDAGKTWAHIGLEDTQHIARIVVDPKNSDVVFVAAFGHAYGSNVERGVFRSADGGKTWQKVLYKDDKTGAIDLAMDPGNSHILYAALYEAYRNPWTMVSGGPGSGLYKSSDGGITWTQLTGHGLPEGVLGRIGIAVGADSSRLYALIEAKEGGLYRSDDAGETWQKVTDDHRFTQRAWYFTHIFADPKSPDTLYILNTGMYRSTDAGKTFTSISAPHGDRHGLWIDPADPNRMIESDDGGATVTQNGGKSWTTEGNQPTAQFYHISTDNQFNYYLYGAQQDNSTVAIASRSDEGAIDRPDWYSVGGGESGYIIPDPRDPLIVYAGSYDGLITRYNRHDGETQDVSPWPLNPMGSGAAGLEHRFQWTAPIAGSPQDPSAIYFGGEAIFKTTDGGMSWTQISPDLTRNDKTKQQSSGGPITQDNTSVEYYDTVFTIAESPKEKGLIWAGSDDGLVHLTRDGGKNWSNVTPKGFPEWAMISLIEPSLHDAGTAFVAVDAHKLDDYRPYIFVTGDYGKTWKKLGGGIPDTSYVHVVRQDPVRGDLLFAGTETGIYVSFDGGVYWKPLQLNLPRVPVHDIAIHGNDLIVATHGRAFWVLDDITPLRQMEGHTREEEAHLFTPQPAYRFRGGGFRVPRNLAFGSNPPAGAIINYTLKSAPKEPLTLEILDADGKLVRKYSSKKEKEGQGASEPGEFGGGGGSMPSTDAGINRFVWDLRYEPPSRVPGAVSWGGRPIGPLAAPGNYQVKLTVAGKSYTAPLEVKKDPRVEASDADLQKQFDLALKLRARITEGHDAVNEIRDVRTQLQALQNRLGSDPQYKDISVSAADLIKKLDAIESSIIQPKSKTNEDPLNYPIQVADQLMALDSTVEDADAAPTQACYQVFDVLSKQLDEQLAKWRDARDKDLAALNQKIAAANIPAIAPAPAKHEPSGG
ncbi:MAG: WD40/YVTN/BNR-like repeat-containing protein [Candidatus Acidiferrales bacterium]